MTTSQPPPSPRPCSSVTPRCCSSRLSSPWPLPRSTGSRPASLRYRPPAPRSASAATSNPNRARPPSTPRSPNFPTAPRGRPTANTSVNGFKRGPACRPGRSARRSIRSSAPSALTTATRWRTSRSNPSRATSSREISTVPSRPRAPFPRSSRRTVTARPSRRRLILKNRAASPKPFKRVAARSRAWVPSCFRLRWSVMATPARRSARRRTSSRSRRRCKSGIPSAPSITCCPSTASIRSAWPSQANQAAAPKHSCSRPSTHVSPSARPSSWCRPTFSVAACARAANRSTAVRIISPVTL